MFGLNKKTFIRLLIGITNISNLANCFFLSNQKCKIRPTLINLHPNECSHEFHYYSFAVKLESCGGSCNTLYDLPNNVCVPNKTEDLNLGVANIITRTNESKILTKHISCQCKCKCNSDQWCNKDKCWCRCKKLIVCERDYAQNPTAYNCENGKYLISIMDDSAIICDNVIDADATNDEAKSHGETIFNEK